MFLTTIQALLLLECNLKDISDLYNLEAKPSEPTKPKTILANTTMLTTKVSEVTSDAIQLGSIQIPTRVSTTTSLVGVEGEV